MATRQVDLLTHPPESEKFIQRLSQFNHMHSPDGLNDTLLSQGWLLEMAPNVGTVGRMSFQGQGMGWVRSLRLSGSISQFNQ